METKQPSNDHDLLIVLCTKLEGIEQSLRDIKDTSIKVQSDHENRIRELEKSSDILTGKIIGISSVATIVIALILGFLKKQFGI